MKVNDGTEPIQSAMADPLQAAQTLGSLLAQSLEYRAFLEALRAAENNVTVRKLSNQIRACEAALHQGRDVMRNAAEMERLQTELESLPVIQAYQRAEEAVRALFLAVDAIISREAGVDFAANAKRSCCGG